jgi:predicted DsbA family dithiol-disulfide isomerase
MLLYAVDLRIDPVRFARDLAGGRYARRVREDCMSGAQSWVTVTPTFFVNNVRLAGGLNIESLLVAVERACGTYPSAR